MIQARGGRVTGAGVIAAFPARENGGAAALTPYLLHEATKPGLIGDP
jgi:hypothetical protein